MKFEEEFPRLNKSMEENCDDFGRSYDRLGEAPRELIQEHCLDKQKVKDAIKKHYQIYEYEKPHYLVELLCELLNCEEKELGLE